MAKLFGMTPTSQGRAEVETENEYKLDEEPIQFVVTDVQIMYSPNYKVWIPEHGWDEKSGTPYCYKVILFIKPVEATEHDRTRRCYITDRIGNTWMLERMFLSAGLGYDKETDIKALVGETVTLLPYKVKSDHSRFPYYWRVHNVAVLDDDQKHLETMLERIDSKAYGYNMDKKSRFYKGVATAEEDDDLPF